MADDTDLTAFHEAYEQRNAGVGTERRDGAKH